MPKLFATTMCMYKVFPLDLLFHFCVDRKKKLSNCISSFVIFELLSFMLVLILCPKCRQGFDCLQNKGTFFESPELQITRYAYLPNGCRVRFILYLS